MSCLNAKWYFKTERENLLTVNSPRMNQDEGWEELTIRSSYRYNFEKKKLNILYDPIILPRKWSQICRSINFTKALIWCFQQNVIQDMDFILPLFVVPLCVLRFSYNSDWTLIFFKYTQCDYNCRNSIFHCTRGYWKIRTILPSPTEWYLQV